MPVGADAASLAAARWLAGALPDSLPQPEVTVGADRCVSLGWSRAGRFFSASVRADGVLDCAWAGPTDGHGAALPDWRRAVALVEAGAREALA